MARKLTGFILVGMVLGVATGTVAHQTVGADQAQAEEVAGYFSLLADIFLHLIKMIIAPLVFSTLVAGIAHLDDRGTLGRIGGRALAWFLIASLLSLSIGLVAVNAFTPGDGLNLARNESTNAAGGAALNLKDFLLHIFPTSMIKAMADNQILQIVVFSLLVGVALSSIGEKAKPIVILIESMVELMLRITDYVMRMAPLAVFGALASSITVKGFSIIGVYGRLIGEFYISLAALWICLALAGFLFLGSRLISLLRHIREPALIAFSTASSEAAYPKLLDQLDRFGVPRQIYSFVLPLGYSFNLDGSMMYATFATIFIAQAYDIPLDIGTQITILLALLVTSKGIAGVPRASLVVVAATLTQFGLPVEGVAFILAIDHFMDMGRTATNVIGNAIATAVIAKWEGVLALPYPIDDRDPPREHGVLDA